MATPLPVEIRLHRAERTLEVAWSDGARHSLPAEYLRVESPSAEVQGHGPGQKTLVHGRRHVGILRLEPVGHYAVRLLFDDLHDSGIYSWDVLRRLGEEQPERWAAYVEELAARGLSREPRAVAGTSRIPGLLATASDHPAAAHPAPVRGPSNSGSPPADPEPAHTMSGG